MADVHAGGWQSSALCPGTGWALWGALTLGAVIRVQKIPLSDIVDAAIGLTGVDLGGHGQAHVSDQQQAQQ